jgi:hypothetical protein
VQQAGDLAARGRGRESGRFRQKKAVLFFEKKNQKLLTVNESLNLPFGNQCEKQIVKVFCFFFSKKKSFPSSAAVSSVKVRHV